MKALLLQLFLTITLFCLAVVALAQNSYVYVSAQGSNLIAVYSMNQTDGSLVKVEDKAVSGGPASIALSPDKKFIYVSQRSEKTFSSFSIDAATGKLSLINTIPALDNPVNIATDNTGTFLLSVYYAASKAAIYSINAATGNITATPLSSFTTAGTNPHAIKTDPSNQFVYLTNMTGNAIQQFNFDDATGALSPLSPPTISPAVTDGPRHFVFHGTKNCMYVSNELSSTVSVYNYNTTSGLLQQLQNVSTLPASFSGTNTVADVHITPDNQFLYVSNRGHNSLAGFVIDPSSGLLSPNGFYPTQTTPRAFDIDAQGSFVYVAGESSGKLDYFSINKTTGTLDSIAAYTVGNSPSWVKCVSFAQTPTIVCLDLLSIAINSLATTANYRLVLFDQTGTTQVKVLAEGVFNSGNSNFCFHKGSLPPATYQYRLLRGTTIIKQGEVVIN